MTRNAWLWAAVLYAGRDAYLSHETAAEINGLADSPSPVINVTIPANRRVRAPKGVVIHMSSHRPMIWTPPRIPPYSIAEEAVIDLVQKATDRDEVVALVASGFNRKLLTESHLRAVAQTRKKLRWRRELDEIIPLAAGGAHSLLEYRHDQDVQRAHGLPEPLKQAKFRKPDGTNGYRDRYYPQYGGLVIELDGKRFHPDQQGDADRERDNQVAVAGSTLRYGWGDVTRRACETAKQEADALRYRGWTGTLKACSPDCRAVTRSEQARSERARLERARSPRHSVYPSQARQQATGRPRPKYRQQATQDGQGGFPGPGMCRPGWGAPRGRPPPPGRRPSMTR